MAFYTVKAPNGKTYNVEGPEGASQATVVSAVLARHPEAGQRTFTPEPEDEPKEGSVLDVPLQVAKGVSYGVRGITDVFGAENVASKGLRKVEDYLGELLSAQGKDDQAKISQIFKDAEDKGLGAQLGAAWVCIFH